MARPLIRQAEGAKFLNSDEIPAALRIALLGPAGPWALLTHACQTRINAGGYGACRARVRVCGAGGYAEPMSMRLTWRIIGTVGMPVMRVVHVRMRVFHRFVLMLVLMNFGQVKPDAAMPTAIRRSKFSWNANQARKAVATPSMVSSKDAVAASVRANPAISKKGADNAASHNPSREPRQIGRPQYWTIPPTCIFTAWPYRRKATATTSLSA